ncbi:MAG: hypothetical protein HY815_32610 [Candidatus Riflebacteria bacterium]|nr:hypothetical protein [Candidatus Riflebacteria bacterium]
MDSRPSGSAEITHPFHPLRGRRFPILKFWRWSGVETLILQEASRGSFGVPRDWTDRALPSVRDPTPGTDALYLDFRCLVCR